MSKGKNSTEVVKTGFTDDELRGISSFEDAMALAAQEHGPVVSAADELGNGFTVLEEGQKMSVVGVPLMILEWSFNQGDFGDRYTSIRAVAFYEGVGIKKVVINDGGTGITKQLEDYQERTGRTGGILFKRGLRVSEYPTWPKGHPEANKPIPKGVDIPADAGKAATFYLDTSS